jgi:hypothetical protein
MKREHMIIAGIVVIGIACMSSSSAAAYYFSSSSKSSSSSSSPSSSSPAASSGSEAAKKSSDTTHEVSACEADALKMSCKDGMTISEGSLQYGRWDNSTCPGEGVTSTTAPISKSFKIAETDKLKSCIGKSSCEYAGGSYNDAVGDPYVGVYKQAKATYTCKAP